MELLYLGHEPFLEFLEGLVVASLLVFEFLLKRVDVLVIDGVAVVALVDLEGLNGGLVLSFGLHELILVLLATQFQELFVLFQQGDLLLRVLLEVLEIVFAPFVACLSLLQFLSQGIDL